MNRGSQNVYKVLFSAKLGQVLNVLYDKTMSCYMPETIIQGFHSNLLNRLQKTWEKTSTNHAFVGWIKNGNVICPHSNNIWCHWTSKQNPVIQMSTWQHAGCAIWLTEITTLKIVITLNDKHISSIFTLLTGQDKPNNWIPLVANAHVISGWVNEVKSIESWSDHQARV